MGCGTSVSAPIDVMGTNKIPPHNMYPVSVYPIDKNKEGGATSPRTKRFNNGHLLPNGREDNRASGLTSPTPQDGDGMQRRLSKNASLGSNNSPRNSKRTDFPPVRTVGSFDLDSDDSGPTTIDQKMLKKSDEWSFSGKDKNESFLGDDEMGNDRLHSFAFVGEKNAGGLAQFQNQPQECAGCGTAGIAYTCDICENYYLCEECRFSDQVLTKHEPSHTMVPLDGHFNSSRTLGDSYSMMTNEGGNSYLFYNPCTNCKKVIDDTEVVYRCEQCNFLVCENCYGAPNSEHEHELNRFQRRNRNSSVQETVLKTKARSSEGNRIINDYVVVGVLGKGSYAKVKLVQHINTRELYALKIIRRKKPNRSGSTGSSLKKTNNKNGNEMNQEDLLREIAVMKFIDHPNVVQLKEVIEDTDLSRVYVIMEYCEKGPVHVLGNPPLSPKTTHQYASDILKGILHLHHEYLYHRDIKPANCLVDGLGTAKLADFGTCNSIVKQDTQQTPAFQCPETVRGDGENITGNVVDSWSFALTVYQMAFGTLPFDMSTLFSLRNDILSSKKVYIPDSCDPQLRDVLTRMLEKDLKKRMLVAEAASHPYFGLEDECDQSRRMSISTHEAAPKINEDLYKRAAQEIRHGKNLNECFHGVRAIRRLRRKEASKAGAGNVADEEDDDWLNELDSLNNSTLNASMTRRAGAENELDMSELVEQASAAFSTTKNNRVKANTAANGVTSTTSTKVVEAIANLEQNKDKDTVLRLVKIPFKNPPKEITKVAGFVTELRLSYNGLLRVSPTDYSVFKVLKDITINGNKLTEFPVELLKVPRLLRLDLSSNRITSIPSTIRQARFLQRLNMQNNLIRDTGVDGNKNSIFSGPSLRHVRLSQNPLSHIPKALETTTNLTLVLDSIPNLMEEWNAIVAKFKNKPPAVIVWDDYFPEVVRGTRPPVWIASNFLTLYRPHTLETCKVQHVVLFQCSDKRFPKGIFSSEDLTSYFAKLASRVGDMVHRQSDSAGSPAAASSPTYSENNDMVRSAVASALGTLPPVVNRVSRGLVKTFFFVSDRPEDEEGGYSQLVNHCLEVFTAGQSIIFFMPSVKEERDTKDTAIGALSLALAQHEKVGEESEQQREVLKRVMEAARQLYS